MTSAAPILVTGAGGFVGTRLVERLRAAGRPVHVVLRDATKAPRFHALGCAVFRGDVTLRASLAPAARGCGAVVHAARGGSELADAREVNVEGTLNVLAAAAAAGARRAVHLSTVVAHGRHWPRVLTEEAPLVLRGDPYALSKAESERAAFAFGREHGLAVTVIRPTIVYGPGSARMLLELDRVRYEHIARIGGGRGLLNLVYIDDLVDALLLALEVPAAAGEAFLVSGDPPVTWRRYLAELAGLARKPEPPEVPHWRARLAAATGTWRHRFTRRPARVEPEDLPLMQQAATVSIAKARRLLGFDPRVSFEEGMRRSAAWLREAGFLPLASVPSA